MAVIVPIKDLKDTNKFSTLCENTNEPIFVTKNGYGNMVVMNVDYYNSVFEKVMIKQKIYEGLNDIKNGMTIIMDGNLSQIIEFQHVKPGKGPAFVRIKLKNLRTGAIVEDTYNTNLKVEKAHIDKMPMQYLYQDGNKYVFMNSQTYDQIEIPEEKLENEKKFLKEGMEITIDFYEGEIIGITLPEKIEFEVVETEPAVKGNTTNNAMKDATIETGFVVKVPLFINQGEKIIISTKDGKYSSRA